MKNTTIHFPRGFLWGTATASHQVEGNNTNNNWARWEQAGHTNGKSGLACDWWGGRWKEDMDRAAETGQNAHRFSVEWSRIQPTPDRWDESALERYRSMARGMVERGLMPMVTLHHFTDPLWLTDSFGGWENQEVIALFEKFTAKVVDALKEYVTLWCTVNEPNIYAISGYISADFPPGKNNLKLAVRVMGNLARGHAAAYRTIHARQTEARVGYALHYRPLAAAHSWSPLDRLVRAIQHRGVNMAFPSAIAKGKLKSPVETLSVPEVKGTQDYLGVNYYSTDTIKFDLSDPNELFGRRFYPEGSDLSATGFIANVPNSMFDILQWATQYHPNTPIIITENGVEDAEDKMRPRYIAQHIQQVWRAVNFNFPVKGYFHWSLVDNFEWERGWTQRFGLWGLDPETQQRIRRPSVDLYAAICKENGLSAEMVRTYCPEVLEKLFPD